MIRLYSQVDDAENLHFRNVGEIAGTMGMAHLIMSVNLTRHAHMIDLLCALPRNLGTGGGVSKSQSRLLRDLDFQCKNLMEALKEQEKMWFHSFSQGNKMGRPRKTRTIEHVHCPAENPLTGGQECKTRVKRQLIVGAIILFGLLAASSALYSTMELQELGAQEHATQRVNIEVLQEHQTRLQINTRSIELVNKTITRLGLKVINLAESMKMDELIMHADFTMAAAFFESNRVIRGLNMLAVHRLSPDLTQAEETAHALHVLRTKMQDQGYVLGLERMSDLYTCETSYLMYQNGSLVIVVHLPAYKQETKMRLLEFVPVPILLPAPKSSTPDNSHPKSIALTAAPAHQLIAVTQDESAYKAYSHVELTQCKQLAGVYFCPNSNLYDRRASGSCIIGLYKRNRAIITQHCLWKAVEVGDFAAQVAPNRFLLYQSTKAEVKMICEGAGGADDSVASAMVHGLKEVTVPSNCRLYSDSFLMDGQASFTLTMASFTEKTLNMSALFQTADFEIGDLHGILSALRLVGSDAGLTIVNIKSRYAHLNMSDNWNWSYRIIGILITVVVAAVVITLLLRRCGFCKTNRQQNREAGLIVNFGRSCRGKLSGHQQAARTLGDNGIEEEGDVDDGDSDLESDTIPNPLDESLAAHERREVYELRKEFRDAKKRLAQAEVHEQQLKANQK